MALDRSLQGVLVTAALMAAAGAILAGVQRLTDERVRANIAESEREVVRELAGVAATVPDELLALCDEGLVLRRGTTRGYGGELDYIVAFGTDGQVAGVRVLHHAETPGFAGILAPDSDWLAGFLGGDDEVHAVTGATITSRAVMDGVTATTGQHEGAESRCPPTPPKGL